MSALYEHDPSTAQRVGDVLRASAALHTDLARAYADAAPVARNPTSRLVLEHLAAREASMAERLDTIATQPLPWLDIWLEHGLDDALTDLPLPELDRGPAELLLHAAHVDDALWASLRSLATRSEEPRLLAFTNALAQLFEGRRKQLANMLGELDLG